MTNKLLARLHGEPMLIDPDRLQRVVAMVRMAEANSADLAKVSAEGPDDYWADHYSYYRPYSVVDGVLQIPVRGVLWHDFAWALPYATGYEYIRRAFQRGTEDSNVKAIALVIDSPGGEVAGCFDAIDAMWDMKSKPVYAICNESAYSAAYAIASLADRIVVPRTGGVGSIGVVTTHYDESQYLDQMGLKITYIYAGKHKVDGNSTEPLSEATKNRIQARIDGLYDVFVKTVSRNRSLSEEAVRETEALTYSAEDAVSIGLADEIGAPGDAVAAIVAELTTKKGVPGMSKMDPNSATDEVSAANLKQATEAAKAEGLKLGAEAERTRIKAIVESDEAKGRLASALHISLTSDMAPDAAKGLLAGLPVEAKSQPTKTPFEAAMEQGNPELGAEGAPKGDGKPDEVAIAMKFANVRRKNAA